MQMRTKFLKDVFDSFQIANILPSPYRYVNALKSENILKSTYYYDKGDKG